jgi:HEAT repeat protein
MKVKRFGVCLKISSRLAVMLENLDKINWSELGHAYGWATNVPNMIRDLTSADKEVRQKARSDLSSHIIHQGTPYSSTAYAVPFLAELLDAPEIPDREEIASLLAFIAESCSGLQEHVLEKLKMPETIAQNQTTWLVDDRDDTQKRADEAEFDWYAKAIVDSWESVTAYTTLYLRLLESSDFQMQVQLLNLLRFCTNYIAQIEPVLLARVEVNPNPMLAATSLNTLGFLWNLAKNEPPSTIGVEKRLEFLRQQLAPDQNPFIRLMAANAFINLEGKQGFLEVEKTIYDTIVVDSDFPKDAYLEDVFEVVEKALDSEPQIYLDWMLKIIHHEDARVRVKGIWCLAWRVGKFKSEGQRLGLLFRELLDDPDEEIQYWASQALENSPTIATYAVEELLQALQKPEFAYSAMIALGKLQEPRAIPYLSTYLDDPEKVLTVLNQLPLFGSVATPLMPQLRAIFRGDQQVVSPIKVLEFDVSIAVFQAWVARVYIGIGAGAFEALPELRAELAKTLQNEDWSLSGRTQQACVLIEAIGAVGSLAHEAIPDLTAILNSIRSNPEPHDNQKWLESEIVKALKKIQTST